MAGAARVDRHSSGPLSSLLGSLPTGSLPLLAGLLTLAVRARRRSARLP